MSKGNVQGPDGMFDGVLDRMLDRMLGRMFDPMCDRRLDGTPEGMVDTCTVGAGGAVKPCPDLAQAVILSLTSCGVSPFDTYNRMLHEVLGRVLDQMFKRNV